MRGEKNGRRKDLLDKLSPGFLAFGATPADVERCFVSREKKKKKIKEKRKKEMKRNYRLIKRIKRTIIRGRIICHALFIKKCANE